jgi:hypothetical protein
VSDPLAESGPGKYRPIGRGQFPVEPGRAVAADLPIEIEGREYADREVPAPAAGVIPAALIESSIVTNAALSAYSIRHEFVAHELPELRAVYGVYPLETREVWAPRLGNIKGVGLAAAPHHLAEFADLGNAAVQSDRIASFLKSEKWPARSLGRNA